jgi:hypothetical protein
MMALSSGQRIRYAGPLRRVDAGGWTDVMTVYEREYEVVQHQEAATNLKVPFPLIIVRAGGSNYVIEDSDYCAYHDICHVCRSKWCNKKCVPDFARYN